MYFDPTQTIEEIKNAIGMEIFFNTTNPTSQRRSLNVGLETYGLVLINGDEKKFMDESLEFQHYVITENVPFIGFSLIFIDVCSIETQAKVDSSFTSWTFERVFSFSRFKHDCS